MNQPSSAAAPIGPIDFAQPAVTVERRTDGTVYLRNPTALAPHPPHVLAMLARWAAETPERCFLAQREPDGAWRRVSYAETDARAAAIAESLLARGHAPSRPLAILSDNSIEHGLVMLGAMRAGIPVMPVSPAYSLMSGDHAKLKAVIEHHDPSAIFVQEEPPFAKSLAAIGMASRSLITAQDLADWYRTKPGPAAAAALAAVGPDTVAKILLTSGSTGLPKGVINTQRMMCSNQAAVAQCWRFVTRRPPVLVDWLPWNHTFGGNFNFNFVLAQGGTYYIDDGRPVPGRFEATLANLSEIAPTLYLNVPRGFDLLVPALERDERLRTRLFSDLDLIFFAGAALPRNLWERLEELSVRARGVRTPFASSLGATETAPAASLVYWAFDQPGALGLPIPGTEAKLVPNAGKLEMRFRGANITPGYYKRPDLTQAAFDEEGFYRIGDAVRFVDPAQPIKGLLFDGRIAENFKLMTGTWVHAGTLRLAAIAAAAPAIQDAVVTGHDRGEVGLLVFPSPAGARSLCPDLPADASPGAVIARPELRRCIGDGLARHNAQNPGSSTRITRVLLMTEPPQIDAGEITDKGYINQRAVLERRSALVERLYSEPAAPDVVLVPPGGRGDA